MAEFTEGENIFEEIEFKLRKGIEAQNLDLGDRLEEIVRENIASGRGTGAYSTRPNFYSLTPTNNSDARDQRLLAWAKENPSARAPGRRHVRGAAWFPGGYAQQRSIFRGSGGVRPVTFEFTGQMMAALEGFGLPTPRRGVAVAQLGFSTESRSYGPYTNTELAQVLRQTKGAKRNPFAPLKYQREAMFNTAFFDAVARTKR